MTRRFPFHHIHPPLAGLALRDERLRSLDLRRRLLLSQYCVLSCLPQLDQKSVVFRREYRLFGCGFGHDAEQRGILFSNTPKTDIAKRVMAGLRVRFMAELPPHPGDTQTVEILGRNRLVDELLRDGLEVAFPIRDRGIDVIAYADLASSVDRYTARPIQMKAAWKRSFGIDRKYERFPDLIMVYVWHLGEPLRATTFAMTYVEALRIGEIMEWTLTKSWAKSAYSNSGPGVKLNELLEPYRMGSGKWWTLITGGIPHVVRPPEEV